MLVSYIKKKKKNQSSKLKNLNAIFHKNVDLIINVQRWNHQLKSTKTISLYLKYAQLVHECIKLNHYFIKKGQKTQI